MRHLLAVAAVILSATMAGDQSIERLATGYRFTEGPAFGADGLLYFTDQKSLLIATWDPRTGTTAVYRENSGKANGLAFDSLGRLYACESASRRVSRTERDGSVVTVADSFNDKKLNSPNDIWLTTDGGCYFTDPRYGPRENMEQPVEGVYHVSADGIVTLVVDNLVRPNGLMLSADETQLYVGDEAASALWRYPVQDDGSLGAGEKIADVSHPDGMCLDPATGTLYVTGHDGISVLAADGTLIRMIQPPEEPTNCTLGPDGMLYFSAQKSVYRVSLGK